MRAGFDGCMLNTQWALVSAGQAAARATGGDAQRMDVHGIDVSHFQGRIDWKRARRGGVVFAFARATQGARIVDRTFHNNWREMRMAGVVRGSYHLFSPGADPAEQARLFVETAGARDPNDLPPALDISDLSGDIRGGASDAALADAVRIWLRIVETALGSRPILCADPFETSIAVATDLSRYPLWVAHLAAPAPSVPAAWTRHHFWQYSSIGRVPGIDPEIPVDLDRFNGNYDDLLAFIAASAGPAEQADSTSEESIGR